MNGLYLEKEHSLAVVKKSNADQSAVVGAGNRLASGILLWH